MPLLRNLGAENNFTEVVSIFPVYRPPVFLEIWFPLSQAFRAEFYRSSAESRSSVPQVYVAYSHTHGT